MRFKKTLTIIIDKMEEIPEADVKEVGKLSIIWFKRKMLIEAMRIYGLAFSFMLKHYRDNPNVGLSYYIERGD